MKAASQKLSRRPMAWNGVDGDRTESGWHAVWTRHSAALQNCFRPSLKVALRDDWKAVPMRGFHWLGFAALMLVSPLSACMTAAGPEPDIFPARAEGAVRIATFNAYLNRPAEGALIADLRSGDAQARKVAEIIQRAAPDVLLLNEFDYDAAGEAITLFRKNYLGVSQNGAPVIDYPYVFLAPSNAGLPSGHDLDRDGAVSPQPGSRAYGGDAFGYGEFPGQYAMVLLSQYPLDKSAARTFQTFLWKDMPGALLPADWYDAAALADFRLSSKSHWDVPVLIGGKSVHILASHPTPPSFDGPEDRNGKRNHDEIRFWSDYVGGAGGYIYDDKGAEGGLAPGACFVILGDLNADPHDGDDLARGAINRLLDQPETADRDAPESQGGAAAAVRQGGANIGKSGPPAQQTADFGDDAVSGVGNLRLDYVIPSRACLETVRTGVVWPAPGHPHYGLVGPGYPIESSDHRMVWRDVVVVEN